MATNTSNFSADNFAPKGRRRRRSVGVLPCVLRATRKHAVGQCRRAVCDEKRRTRRGSTDRHQYSLLCHRHNTRSYYSPGQREHSAAWALKSRRHSVVLDLTYRRPTYQNRSCRLLLVHPHYGELMASCRSMDSAQTFRNYR